MSKKHAYQKLFEELATVIANKLIGVDSTNIIQGLSEMLGNEEIDHRNLLMALPLAAAVLNRMYADNPEYGASTLCKIIEDSDVLLARAENVIGLDREEDSPEELNEQRLAVSVFNGFGVKFEQFVFALGTKEYFSSAKAFADATEAKAEGLSFAVILPRGVEYPTDWPFTEEESFVERLDTTKTSQDVLSTAVEILMARIREAKAG